MSRPGGRDALLGLNLTNLPEKQINKGSITLFEHKKAHESIPNLNLARRLLRFY